MKIFFLRAGTLVCDRFSGMCTPTSFHFPLVMSSIRIGADKRGLDVLGLGSGGGTSWKMTHD